jgi:hypothetical protein
MAAFSGQAPNEKIIQEYQSFIQSPKLPIHGTFRAAARYVLRVRLRLW